MEVKFYSLAGKASPKWAIARLSDEVRDVEIWNRIKTLRDASQWRTLHFNLSDGALADHQPSDVVGRIFSPKAVEVFRQFSSDVLWLPVKLRQETKEYDYYFMHFTRHPDVLDEPKSLMVNGKVVKPCISLTKASGVPLICFYPLGVSIVVRGDVRDAILAAKLQGVEFQSVCTS